MAAVAENAIGSNDRQFPHRRTPSSPPPQSPPSSDRKSDFQNDVRKLVDLLSKLNPSAKEFIPSSKSDAVPVLVIPGGSNLNSVLSADAPVFDAVSSGGVEYVNHKDPGNDGFGIHYRRVKFCFSSCHFFHSADQYLQSDAFPFPFIWPRSVDKPAFAVSTVFEKVFLS